MIKASGKNLLLVWAFCFFLNSFCNAQDIQITPNVINNNWSGATVGGNISPGGISGGSKPAYNPSTNTIMFGYTQQSVEQNIIMSNVFDKTGVRIYGYELSAQYANSGFSRGTLGLTITAKDLVGFTLQKDSYDLKKDLSDNVEWANFSTTRPYSSPYGIDALRSMTVTVTGKDDRYWAGYYGPQIRDISLRLRYVGDECKTNALYSLSCPGYEQAYLTSQCSINSLYSPSCPGYQQAYNNQQCSLNPLFSPVCSGYAQALFTKNCTDNPLSNMSCPGYAQALFTKTCNENQLSDIKCPLYQQAYLDQQCKNNPLFSSSCPLYQKAFFDQQCTINPLYNSGCPGYAEAFKAKQIADSCLSNPQSNPSCKGYETPKIVQKVEHQASVLINEDPVKLLTTPRLVDDPIVNQTIQSASTKIESTQQPQSSQPSGQISAQRPSERTTSQQQSKQSQKTSTGSGNRSQQSSRKDAKDDPQDVAIASIGNVPGFGSYTQANIPDVPFYKVEDIYKRVTIADNARALRQLNQRSDKIHRDMVDQQYQGR